MDGVIRAHCMGMEFPKRDTDGPNVEWVSAVTDRFLEALAINLDREIVADAVAEEQRVKEKTSANRSD